MPAQSRSGTRAACRGCGRRCSRSKSRSAAPISSAWAPSRSAAATISAASRHFSRSRRGGAISCSSSPPIRAPPHVAPYGGRAPVMTPDPIAAGIPREPDPILDRRQHVDHGCGHGSRLCARPADRCRATWLLDAEGKPTDDPAALEERRHHPADRRARIRLQGLRPRASRRGADASRRRPRARRSAERVGRWRVGPRFRPGTASAEAKLFCARRISSRKPASACRPSTPIARSVCLANSRFSASGRPSARGSTCPTSCSTTSAASPRNRAFRSRVEAPAVWRRASVTARPTPRADFAKPTVSGLAGGDDGKAVAGAGEARKMARGEDAVHPRGVFVRRRPEPVDQDGSEPEGHPSSRCPRDRRRARPCPPTG